MHPVSSMIFALTLMTCGGVLVAQEPSTPPVQAPAASVTRSCTDLKPKARQECLKVARQMDSDAVAPETTSSSSSIDTVHHSSPVMETAEEKSAAAKAAKSSKRASKAPPRPKPDDTQRSPDH